MLEKELETLILTESDVIPLLKELSIHQKKKLVPFIKRFHKKLNAFETVIEKTKWGGESYNYKYLHSEVKRKLIEVVCVVCLNKTDAKKTLFNIGNIVTDEYYLENVIPWCVPKWYNDIINEEMPWNLSYSKMMKLQKKGCIVASASLIVNYLPLAIINNSNGNQKQYVDTSTLFEFEETLQEHIWLLFEEESGINDYYGFAHLENYEAGNDLWLDTITKLVDDGNINRNRVLQATILTSTRGYNKRLGGWFFKLLLKLEATPDEIVGLQKELLTAISSPHSMVVNTTLKHLKSIATNRRFQHKVFIENASILLNSETKTVVNSTLMILDKIAKNVKTSRKEVCIKATEALIHTDEKIQTKVAKLILKYGNARNQDLIDEISLYSEGLFHTAKEFLVDFHPLNQEETAEDINKELNQVLDSKNKIQVFNSFNELVFFTSQVVDNNEPYDIELLFSVLPKLNLLVNDENIEKLETVFKRAFDLSLNVDWQSRVGMLEFNAAYLINDFGEILMSKFPQSLSNFRKYKNKKLTEIKNDYYYQSHLKNRILEIEKQILPDYIYHIHHKLATKSKKLIIKNRKLDLLSTPTHKPCWINPYTLIDRIKTYESIKEPIDLYDFQVAIGRLPYECKDYEIKEEILSISTIGIRETFLYHFGFLNLNELDFEKVEFWLQSLLVRNNISEIEYAEEKLHYSFHKELGLFDWKCKMEEVYYNDYDYIKRKNVRKKMVKREMNLIDFHINKKKSLSLTSELTGLFKKAPKFKGFRNIYKVMYFNRGQYGASIDYHDSLKFLFISPNNPSMFLSHIIHHLLRESNHYDTTEKTLINLLKGLHQIWIRPDINKTTYLFLATTLLSDSKVARELAAEIWIKTTNENNMDHDLIGNQLGRLQNAEYGPLKRFTDLITSNMFQISKFHDDSLFILMDRMIGEMADKPIRGAKKLLEIFVDLHLRDKSRVLSNASSKKLENWKMTKSLKPLVSKISFV